MKLERVSNVILWDETNLRTVHSLLRKTNAMVCARCSSFRQIWTWDPTREHAISTIGRIVCSFRQLIAIPMEMYVVRALLEWL
jgi:hypothetical protein